MIPSLRDFCREHPDERAVVQRMLELEGQNWRRAEREWRRLLKSVLRDIPGVESEDERLQKALKLATEVVMKP